MTQKTILLLLLSLCLASVVVVSQDQAGLDLRAADNLWNDGNYIGALTAYIRLLNSPSGDQYLEPIALQTGELFVTEELSADGRNPRLSPDGRFISYETGPAKNTVTRIRRTEGAHQQIAEFEGTNAVFAPDGSKIAYVRIPVTEELTKAQQALDNQTEPGPERTYAQQMLTRLQSKGSRIILRDLSNQNETELKTGDLLKQPAIVFGRDSMTVYFVGAPESETRRNDIYAVTATSAPIAVTDADGFKT